MVTYQQVYRSTGPGMRSRVNSRDPFVVGETTSVVADG